jgi:hypothetical protein
VASLPLLNKTEGDIMKRKLIVIGILVLFLCATVPMAASAANDRKPIVEKVYYMTMGDPNWNVHKSVGEIKFNPATGAYSVVCHKLDPNVQYVVGVTDGPKGEITEYLWIAPHNPGDTLLYSDAHGNLKVTGVDPYPPTVLLKLEQGGIFIITPGGVT